MPIISVAGLNQQLDGSCQMFVRALGLSGPYGIALYGGAYGSAQASATMLTNILALNDADVLRALVAASQDMSKAADGKKYIQGVAGQFLQQLLQHILTGQFPNVRSLDDYLTYMNVGAGAPAYWQCIQHPAWYDVYAAINSGAVPSICNLYYPALQSVYTNGLGKFIASGAGAGAFTKAVVSTSGYGSGLIDDGSGGAKIDTSKYAGGNPQVNVSGLAGSGVVTVTGDSYDPVSKTVQAGKTWTATVAGNGVTALAVGTAPANSLITRVTNITIAAGITAGTIYVEAAAPAGRLSVP